MAVIGARRAGSSPTASDGEAAPLETVSSIEWTGEGLTVLDQRCVPDDTVFLQLTTIDGVIEAIATLAVRGANVLGTAGAFGYVLGLRAGLAPEDVAARVIAARPTAVNLRVAVELAHDAQRRGEDPLGVALRLLDEDREACATIGELGRQELAGRDRLLTHCNTGALATTGRGTALGIVYAKAEAGEPVTVLATETRPLRQGARLTVWELHKAGIPVTLLVDSAAAAALVAGKADAVVVGADRIAANGDTANKVGTLALAIAAKHAGVPFYVAATWNAIDASTPDGSAIPIEERAAAEVLGAGPGAAAADTRVWNPAFDVTPAGLITGIVTERGVLHAPYGPAIAQATR
ncbi:S-methyl-5-thioribose-1-phosphate isomerase [Amnibacterium sp. CER49]|uniref:S-methyl-5-thioribose-1-phosphate isomerase n=1 Tax=Amnibacterium sp. CER49 TaxID=3039161 RepID=UPI00244B6FEA|nr:S-methyl-5-thioribose-1-phosphate isomerase [Amnibacterium sp. CER49]MDH2445126.1 S-methyl-5-thioribose-1-phosphate isomerase [Amnibacterium sp. CER49]